MNILANAIDALEEGSGGRLRRETFGERSVESRSAERGQGLESNRPPTIRICTEVTDTQQVRICIADNGLGMTEEVRNRLFDPFFTTKSVGKGTGLGLSISYQIVVERHQGSLQCFSELGQGCEFWIEVPIAQNAPDEGKPTNAEYPFPETTPDLA